MAQTYHFSHEAFKRLEREYDDLTNRGRIEIAQKIETARELGDLSENGDYHAAKEEQGKMEGRIAQLSVMLENAEIVEVDADAQEIQAGCIVGIKYEGDDEVETYLIGSIEEKRDGVDVMSPGSPIGKALLGAKVGDAVSYEAPGGTLSVEVISIDV
jgi:transcription elongation factor GreA